jgi:arylsulfatase
VASGPLPTGKAQIVFEYQQDLLKQVLSLLRLPKITSGTGRLFVDGTLVGERHFAQFGAFASSINETFDVGRDSGSPVSKSYESPFAFTGKVKSVTIELK